MRINVIHYGGKQGAEEIFFLFFLLYQLRFMAEGRVFQLLSKREKNVSQIDPRAAAAG